MHLLRSRQQVHGASRPERAVSDVRQTIRVRAARRRTDHRSRIQARHRRRVRQRSRELGRRAPLLRGRPPYPSRTTVEKPVAVGRARAGRAVDRHRGDELPVGMGHRSGAGGHRDVPVGAGGVEEDDAVVARRLHQDVGDLDQGALRPYEGPDHPQGTVTATAPGRRGHRVVLVRPRGDLRSSTHRRPPARQQLPLREQLCGALHRRIPARAVRHRARDAEAQPSASSFRAPRRDGSRLSDGVPARRRG